MRKKKQKYVSKYENDAVLVHSKVLKIELQNQEINGKLKTVFYCESKAFPEGTFVVWSLMFRRREQSATA